MAISSFEPGTMGCGSQGNGYLHMVNTFTGLPDARSNKYLDGGETNAKNDLTKEQTGVIYMGAGNPTEPFVTMSASGITVSASSSSGGMSTIFLPKNKVLESGVTSWREVMSFGFELSKEAMSKGLD
jgi:Tfp pilus tip-associated adhesin PilY1